MDQTPRSQGHIYEVASDSTLGVQISNYVKRCTMCNAAIRDFLRSVEKKYSFPLHITDDTIYTLSDDCDAGGLLAIVVKKQDWLMARTSDPHFYVLWDTMPSPDNDDEFYVFPRIETTTHYVKYGLAVRLCEHGAPDWDFSPPTLREQASGLKLHRVTYDEVRQHISTADRNNLVSKPGQTPSPVVRLAVGRQYKLNTDTLPDCPERSGDVMTQNFSDAVALYKEWMALPTVPANTLARTLRLKSPSADGRADAELCFCEWRSDVCNHRYLIHTGLVSSMAEMSEATDEFALSLFNK